MASPPTTGPSLTNLAGINQVTVLNAVVPPEGPKALPLVLDFTSLTSILVDLTSATAQAKISTVQMIFADNTANSALLTVTVSGAGQVVRIPPGCQGWFPVVATNRPKLTFATVAGVVLQAILLNVPVAQGIWFPSDTNAHSAPQSPLAFSVVTGGTAVSVFNSTSPNTVPSDGAVIVNPWAATESLFVDIVNTPGTTAPGASGTTVELKAGASFAVPPGFHGNVQVNAVSSGHVFSAYGAGHTS